MTEKMSGNSEDGVPEDAVAPLPPNLASLAHVTRRYRLMLGISLLLASVAYLLSIYIWLPDLAGALISKSQGAVAKEVKDALSGVQDFRSNYDAESLKANLKQLEQHASRIHTLLTRDQLSQSIKIGEAMRNDLANAVPLKAALDKTASALRERSNWDLLTPPATSGPNVAAHPIEKSVRELTSAVEQLKPIADNDSEAVVKLAAWVETAESLSSDFRQRDNPALRTKRSEGYMDWDDGYKSAVLTLAVHVLDGQQLLSKQTVSALRSLVEAKGRAVPKGVLDDLRRPTEALVAIQSTLVSCEKQANDAGQKCDAITKSTGEFKVVLESLEKAIQSSAAADHDTVTLLETIKRLHEQLSALETAAISVSSAGERVESVVSGFQRAGSVSSGPFVFLVLAIAGLLTTMGLSSLWKFVRSYEEERLDLVRLDRAERLRQAKQDLGTIDVNGVRVLELIAQALRVPELEGARASDVLPTARLMGELRGLIADIKK